MIKDYNIEKALEHISKSDIIKQNKIHISNFNKQQAAEGLSKARQVKYLYILKKVAKMIGKDFSKADKNDII